MARITKQNIIDELSLQDIFADQPKYKVKEFVEDFLQNIMDRVSAGDDVAIAGFGKFEKFERTADGKGTGVFVPKFRPAKAFNEAVAN